MKQLSLLLITMAFSVCLLAIPNSNEMTKKEQSQLFKNIEQLPFAADKYFTEATPKTQICLHHTASGRGVSGDLNQFSKPGKICTPIIVGSDKIYQLHSTKYWGYHLGIKSEVFKKHDLPYANLNKSCIGLEIDSWGPLKYIDGEYRAWPNAFGQGNQLNSSGDKLKVVINEDEVVHYKDGFRGYQHYQKYSAYQIEATSKLLRYWSDTHNIPLTYNEDMWDVSVKALEGSPGVYSHVSFRPDKSDCHPQPELIDMLKSLS